MIKANELRIGNTILSPDTGKWVTVELNHLRAIIDGVKFNGKHYEAVRLTDKIIEQIGFEKGNVSGGTNWTEYESFHGKIDLVKDNENYYLWNECEDGFYSYKSSIPVNSLHHLQNMYLDLTGKELTVNHTALSLLH